MIVGVTVGVLVLVGVGVGDGQIFPVIQIAQPNWKSVIGYVVPPFQTNVGVCITGFELI